MTERDPIEAIVDLISLIDEVTVTGPDEDGSVRLAGGSGGSEPVVVNLGKAGTPAADAALRWREEEAQLG